MESQHREVIYVLLIVAFFFVMMVPGFLYIAHLDLVHQEQQAMPVPHGAAPGLTDETVVNVKIGGAVVNAEIARSAAKKELGLSGRDALAENAGMLFIFDAPKAYTFWNKDMRFSLDMIWMRNNTVVDISKGLPAFSGTPVTLAPKEPVDAVLEVNAGFVLEHQIKIGDHVIL